jgi:spore coat-associated protein N
MQRAAVLWRASPGRVVGVLFALMAAAAMAVGSGANFNSTSANVGNVVSAGILKHTNSGGTILNVGAIKPGETKSGTVTLTNTGNIDGALSLKASSVTPVTPAGQQPLAPRLTFEVKSGSTSLWTGTLAQLQSGVSLGTLAVGPAKTFTVQVTMADGGPNGADNQYQGSGVSATFDWETVSS